MNAPSHSGQLLVERADRAMTMLMVGKLRAGSRQGLCRIRNVSIGGMMIETRLPLACGEEVVIDARGRQEVTGTVVWVLDGRAGVRFAYQLPPDRMLAAVLEPQSRIARNRVPRGPRVQLHCKVEVQLSSGRVDAMLKDISQGGAKLIMPVVMRRHERLLLMVPGLPMKLGLVCWAAEETGIAFAQPLGFDLLAEWLLIREAAAPILADAIDG